MPAQPIRSSYWGDKHQPFVRIGTDEKELRALADAIVGGASIAHAQIADLRALIEAVRRHPHVILRPPKDADAISDANKVKPTSLVIHGGRVVTCDCSELDIRVTLSASTRFGDEACFAGATFGEQASFNSAAFGEQASFDWATFGKKADFSEATLRRASFRGAFLRRANIRLAKIGGIDVSKADLAGVRGLFGPHRATAADQLINEQYVQLARFHRKWDLMPWTLLRVIGALRLFGVSYGSIILIVIYVKFAKWYNTSFAVQVRADAQRKIDEGIDWRWREILANLPDLPVPGHLATQLIAILVLALGATFYQRFCPELVKEATETRWTRQRDQALVEYRSAMWSHIVRRYVTALFLLIGGLYTIGYLSIRLWDALRYLFIH